MFVSEGIAFQSSNSQRCSIARFSSRSKGTAWALAQQPPTPYVVQQPLDWSGIVSQGGKKACWERRHPFVEGPLREKRLSSTWVTLLVANRTHKNPNAVHYAWPTARLSAIRSKSLTDRGKELPWRGEEVTQGTPAQSTWHSRASSGQSTPSLLKRRFATSVSYPKSFWSFH